MDVDFIVLIGYSWEEEYKSTSRFEQISGQNNQILSKVSQFVRLCRRNIWRIIAAYTSIRKLNISSAHRTYGRELGGRHSVTRSFFLPNLLAPALTPSGRLIKGETTCAQSCLQGGSVIIASKSSPHLHGFLVTSKVQRSMTLLAMPY